MSKCIRYGTSDLQLTFVIFVFCKEPADNVPNTTRDVHERALLSKREAGGNGESKAKAFGKEGTCSKVAMDDEAREDGLDLWNTRSSGLKGITG